MLSLKDSSKEYVGTYQLIIKSQPLSEDARTFLLPNHTFEKGTKKIKLILSESFVLSFETQRNTISLSFENIFSKKTY